MYGCFTEIKMLNSAKELFAVNYSLSSVGSWTSMKVLWKAEKKKKKIKHMQSKTASEVKEVSKGDELQCQSRVNKWNYLQYNVIIRNDILFIIYSHTESPL